MSKKRDKAGLRVRSSAKPMDAGQHTAAPPRGLPERRARFPESIHPSGVRRVTERRVAHLLLRSPGLSRGQIAQQTGLSVATIGNIVDDLVSAGIVEKTASETTQPGPIPGRPAEYFGLSRGRHRYVVVELGVNKTQVAALPIAGPVGDTQMAQFRTTADLDTFKKRLKTAAGALDVDDPIAVLISVPGVVDEFEQRVLYSPNLHWTEGTRLFDVISRAIPGQLVVVQEIRALALGYLVHSDPYDSYLLVDTGDGVGGALVIDGRLQTGPLPLSAEIGHTPILGNRRRCGCGGVGCLETLLGRRGLLRTARRYTKRNLRTWMQLVAELADRESPEWLRSTLCSAAHIIAGALNTTGVSKVVLVGDMLELGAGVLECMAVGINTHALWGRFGNIRVEAAPRRRLLGLARAALDRVVLPTNSARKADGQRAWENGA